MRAIGRILNMNNLNKNNFNHRGNSLNSRGTIAYQGANMQEQQRLQNNFPAFNNDWRNQSSGYVPNQNNMAEQMRQNSFSSFNNNWQNQSSGSNQMPPTPLPPYNIDWRIPPTFDSQQNRNNMSEQIQQDSFRSFNTESVNQSLGQVSSRSQDGFQSFNSGWGNQSLNVESNQTNLAEQIIRNAISICNSEFGRQASEPVSNNFNIREQNTFIPNNNSWNEQSSRSNFDNNRDFGFNDMNQMRNSQRNSQFMNSFGNGNNYKRNKRVNSSANRDNSNVNSKSRRLDTNIKYSERNRSSKKLPALNKPGERDDPLKKGLSENGVNWYLHFLKKGFSPQVSRNKALKSEPILTKQAVKTFAMNCKLGEPGGRDDPFRMGLSGAGVKWYFRYLKLGLSPQDARKKVDERPTSVSNSQAKKNGNDATQTSKPERVKEELKPEDARKLKAEEHISGAPNNSTKKVDDIGKLQHQPVKGILKKSNNKPSTSKQSAQDLPSLGEPGGLDDPLRKGLSGSGVKWYLRFLKQGLKPENARKKADEHRNPLNKTASSNSTLSSNDKKSAQKPELKQAVKQSPSTKPVVDQQKDKNATNPEGKGNGNNLNRLRIAVLPKKYPEEVLSSENQAILEDIIMKEVSKGWKTPLVFKGIYFKQGLLFIDCGGQDTADWLQNIIPKLDSWKGTELMACQRDNIPQTYSMNILLPRTTQSEREKSLNLIKAQNDGFDTTLWKVVSSKESGQNLLTNIIIDQKSFDAIKEQGSSIHFRFGKIMVQLNKTVPRVQEKAKISAKTDVIETPKDEAELTTTVEEIPLTENDSLTETIISPAGITDQANSEIESMRIKEEIDDEEQNENENDNNKQLAGEKSCSAET